MDIETSHDAPRTEADTGADTGPGAGPSTGTGAGTGSGTGNTAEAARGTLPFTEQELATGVLAVVGCALLLRVDAVRSLVKLGALGAAGWAAYRYAEKSGWLQPAAPATDQAEPGEPPPASPMFTDAFEPPATHL